MEKIPDHSIADTIFSINDESALRQNALYRKLYDYINNLLLHDFEKLVSLLYRIDVSEQKIKALLVFQPDTDAADIIATAIIERQIEKIKIRKKFTPPIFPGEEEKW